MSQRLNILRNVLLTPSIISNATSKVLLGSGLLFSSYNGIQYIIDNSRLSNKYKTMRKEFATCMANTTEEKVVNVGYDVTVHYGIENSDLGVVGANDDAVSSNSTSNNDLTNPTNAGADHFGGSDLTICIPEHGAWFSDFGLNSEDVKDIRRLVDEGKVVIHRTPHNLYVCIGDANLAPGISLGDNAFTNNYAASSMNSPQSKRFDIVMHATPDESADRQILFRETSHYLYSHAAAVALGALSIRIVWKSTLKKHLDNFVQSIASGDTPAKGWNRFSFKVALAAGVGGSLTHAAFDFKPLYQQYQIMNRHSGLYASSSFGLFAAILAAKSFGILVQMTFLYFLMVRFVGVRYLITRLKALSSL